MTRTLLLLRNAETPWNLTHQFLGWVDVGLTEVGRQQARRGGEAMALALAGVQPRSVHTSLLRRSILTAQAVLAAADRDWIEVRRNWRLNERHYGAFQGRDEPTAREIHGDDVVTAFRASTELDPPLLPDSDEFSQFGDARYRGLLAAAPRSESLADVRSRTLPYFFDTIVPDLRAGTVLASSHGNPLRTLVAHLEGVDLQAVRELNLEPGLPLRYELDERSLRPVRPAEYVDGSTFALPGRTR